MAKTLRSIGKLHEQRFHEDDRRRGFYDVIPGLSGEMNVTHIPRGSIAGMHLHKKQTDHFVVAKGAVLFRLVTVDGREERITLSPYARKTLSIPPGIWHGYKALEDSVVLFYIDQKFNTEDEHRRKTTHEDWVTEIK